MELNKLNKLNPLSPSFIEDNLACIRYIREHTYTHLLEETINIYFYLQETFNPDKFNITLLLNLALERQKRQVNGIHKIISRINVIQIKDGYNIVLIDQHSLPCSGLFFPTSTINKTPTLLHIPIHGTYTS
jgi:hypothetical protein